jgi:HEAT repeat protein
MTIRHNKRPLDFRQLISPAFHIFLLIGLLVSPSWGQENDDQRKSSSPNMLHALVSAPHNSRDADRLLEIIRSTSTAVGQTYRKVALSVLSEPDQKASAELVSKYKSLLDDTDTDVQAAAILACGKLKLTDSTSKIVSLLNRESETVQIAAIRTSENLNAAGAAPRIFEILQHQPRHHFSANSADGATPTKMQLSWSAARTLTTFRYSDALDELLSRDEILGMGSFGGPLIAEFGAQAIPKVLPIARTAGSRQGGALSVIAHIKDASAIPELLALAADNDPGIQEASISALAEMPVKSDAEKNQIETLLIQQMHSTNPNIRGYVYRGLIRGNSDRYLDILMAAARSDTAAGLDIFYGLMNHPNPRAIPYLKEFIAFDETKNPAVTLRRSVAARAIYKISGEKVPYKGVERDLADAKKGFRTDPYEGRKR